MSALSWPSRAVICRKDSSYILYNYSGGFTWYLFGPDNRLQHNIGGTLGNGTWGVGTYDKDAGPGLGRDRGAGTRRASTAGRRRCGRLSHGVGANAWVQTALGWSTVVYSPRTKRGSSSPPAVGPSARKVGISSEAVDEAYMRFFGAFGAAWDDAIVGRWSS